ncbi:MAG: cytochrome c family protein [Phycisphaera sp.]|nr:MAG: cytochrome c family protein [Phycisphaera sp.]
MYKTTLAAAVLLLTLTGCNKTDKTPAVPSPEAIAKAEAARDELMKTLKGELIAAIGEGGPASAITVCKDRAPAIAQEVAANHNVRIGRTSFSLRNQANTPPAWVADLIKNRTESQNLTLAQDGTLHALYPVRTKPECLLCHGDPDSTAPAIKEQITALYPQDNAMGFALNDLRGYVWVEVDDQ